MRHVALLRGVNVGGRNRLSTSTLLETLDAAGHADAQVLMQSGNVILQDRGPVGADLERAIEAALLAGTGLDLDVMIRSADEWRAIVAAMPLEAEAARDPSHVICMVFKDDLRLDRIEALQSSHAGPETIRAGTKDLYVAYPEGIGRSRLTSGLIEGRLGQRGTARNWTTVLRIADRLG